MGREVVSLKAEQLPRTDLCYVLETSVRNLPIEGVESIHIRVVASDVKVSQVSPKLLEVLGEGSPYPKEIPYRQRIILIFETQQDKSDLLLYAMYVQEYGPDSCPSNKNCIYISYLERVSTHNCKGRTLKAPCDVIFHEVILSYLQDVEPLQEQ